MDTQGHDMTRPGIIPEAATKAWGRKWSFLALFVWFFIVTVGIMGALDMLPETDSGTQALATGPSISAAATLASDTTDLPVKIDIPSIKLSVKVANPTSTDVTILDKALLSGAVRYPSSSKLGETGNVIIFGHSSYLPVVHNKAFKAFDGIQNLHKGDRILVTGADRVYTYEVETVVSAKADQDFIPLTASGSKLTLATCDSFGTHNDRFVVTAQLVESNPVSR